MKKSLIQSHLLLMTVVLALVLSACAPAAAPAATTGSEPAATTEVAEEAAAGEPITGGEMTFAIATEPDGVDAHLTSYANSFLINRNVCDSLLAKDAAGEFIPHLATAWESSEDGLTYTFTLRDDVTFTDGTPFNAEAVKYNLERVASPELASRLAVSYLGPFESAEVIDEYTVAVNFSAPHAAFLNVFASWIGMVSPTAAAAADPADFAWAPVCSGPFMVEEYVAQSHLSIVVNPDYNWAPENRLHQGRAYLDRVTFRFITDENTRTAVLENGEAQAIKDVPPSAVTMLMGNDAYTVIEDVLAGPGIHFVPNISRAPFDDVLVRQAILYGTSQDEIRDFVFQGNGPTIHGVFSETTPCYDETSGTMYTYDPEKAGELLDEAGWVLNDATGLREKDGETLTLTLTAVNLGNASEINELMIDQWTRLGIQTESELLASSAIQVARAQSADFDVIWRDFGANDPNILSTLFHSKNAGPEKGWNFTHQGDAFPELDALLDEGDVVTDQAARCAVYAEAQQFIMEQALLIPARPRISYVASADGVNNMVASWAGVVDIPFYDVWLDQ